jgi:hypothetical protein
MGMQKDSRRTVFADFPLAAIRVTVLDTFSHVIPRADRSRWPLSPSGRPLLVRNKRPLRRIYPRDMEQAPEDTVYRLRRVWLPGSIEPACGGRP